MPDKPGNKNMEMRYVPFLLDNHSRKEHSAIQMIFWLNREKYILSLEFDEKRIYEETLMVYTHSRPTKLYSSYQQETDHSDVVADFSIRECKLS